MTDRFSTGLDILAALRVMLEEPDEDAGYVAKRDVGAWSIGRGAVIEPHGTVRAVAVREPVVGATKRLTPSARIG